MKPSFDAFVQMVDRAVDRVPPRFCRGLTGGFNVQKSKKRDGGYYIMGEYTIDGLLGSFIVFYYGSFLAVLDDAPLSEWEAEIDDTVLHELQHHLEAMAGRDDLARKEAQELAEAMRREKG